MVRSLGSGFQRLEIWALIRLLYGERRLKGARTNKTLDLDVSQSRVVNRGT